MPSDWFFDYMRECRTVVIDEMQRLVRGERRGHQPLYDLVMDYPLRSAKALRPSLCIATCRALGGNLSAVAGSAMTVELYHNAFLIHDDVEDGSSLRRDAETLHEAHGLAVAVNVGDAMLALALEPLLDNLRVLGVGKSLRILQIISRMARKTAEGQAIELSWCRSARWNISDADYIRMVHKKTTYYSFLAPVAIGAVVAGADREQASALAIFATALGSSFQIRDDILNLSSSGSNYGKDLNGDLWEGKHTLILLHALRCCTDAERERALEILALPRLGPQHAGAELRAVLDRLRATAELSVSGMEAIEEAVGSRVSRAKQTSDIDFLRDLIDRHRSIEWAQRAADRRAALAHAKLSRIDSWLAPGIHRDFIHELTSFVAHRQN